MSGSKKPTMTILSSEQVERIHNASLQVLWQTGAEIKHEPTLKMLNEAGAKIDLENCRAYLPAELIESCISRATNRVVLQARNSEKDLVLEPDGELYFRSFGGPDHIVDMYTGQRREINSNDLKEWTTIVDALPNVNYCMGIYPNDVHLANRDVYVLGRMFQYTEKHLHIQPYIASNTDCMIEISNAISDSLSQPRKGSLFSVFVSSKSPLCYPKNEVEILLTAGQNGVPVMLNSSPMAGGNGPVTIAGATVLLNAETLVLLVISQLANPGSPVVYSPRPLTLDMQTTICAGGYIENSMATIAALQIAREKYDIPTDMFGPMTDAHLVGAQSVMEATYTALIPALAGANIVAAFGMLSSLGAVSPLQLVVSDELMSVIRRFVRGFEINDDTLAIDVIDQVSRTHNFLDTEHTFKHYKSEYLMPELFVRTEPQRWTADGKEDMICRASKKLKHILANHRPAELPKEVINKIDAVIARPKMT